MRGVKGHVVGVGVDVGKEQGVAHAGGVGPGGT